MAAYKQFVRQAPAQAGSAILPVGTAIVETQSWTWRIHDGVTPGGIRVPLKSENDAAYAPINSPQLTGLPTAPNIADVTNSSTQIANANFVQSVASTIGEARQVDAATLAAGDTAGLAYTNGASGIGGKLTGANNVAVTIDGFVFTTIGQRLLVKNDTQTTGGAAAGAFNGEYQLTQLQGVGVPAIFTRIANFNQLNNINFSGMIFVKSGTVNGGSRWICSTVLATNTVGITSLTFIEAAATVVGAMKVGGGLTSTLAGGVAFAARGANNATTRITLGRVADDGFIGVVGTNDNFFAGTVAGDLAIGTYNTAGLFIGAANNLGIKITAAGLTTISGNVTVGGINKVTITPPATAATLTIADGKTFTVNNSITLVGTDAQIYTFPTTNATIARTDAAQTFTGLQTFGALTATGAVSLANITALGIRDTSAAFDLTLAGTSSTALSAGRKLTFDVVNADRTLKVSGNSVINQDVSTSGSPLFASVASIRPAGVTLAVNGTWYTAIPAANFLTSSTYIIGVSTVSNVTAPIYAYSTNTGSPVSGIITTIYAGSFFGFAAQIDGAGNFQMQASVNAPVTVVATAFRIA